MIDPVVGGSLVSGGFSLLGGSLGNRAAKRARRQDIALQKEFAQHGVQWRVEDAKAAGIHPLAALGMQGVPYSPVGFQDSLGSALAEAGQSIGGAVSRTMTAGQKAQQLLGLRLVQSQIDETDMRTRLLQSEIDRNRYEMQPQVQTFPVPDNGAVIEGQPLLSPQGTVLLEDSGVPSGQVLGTPAGVISAKASNEAVMAGDTPLWRNFKVAPGVVIGLPGGVSGDAAEVLESLAESPVMFAAVLRYNQQHHPEAAAWLKDMFGVKEQSSWWRRPGEWLGGKLYDWFGPLPKELGHYRFQK